MSLFLAASLSVRQNNLQFFIDSEQLQELISNLNWYLLCQCCILWAYKRYEAFWGKIQFEKYLTRQQVPDAALNVKIKISSFLQNYWMYAFEKHFVIAKLRQQWYQASWKFRSGPGKLNLLDFWQISIKK